MKLKSLRLAITSSFLVSLNAQSALTTGDDVLYAVQAVTGSTQDFGTIDPASGTFTRIAQISPTNLGWPLGDIGSEPDPINGYVYTRQTNTTTSDTDILAIKKSDGSTKWLGLTSNDLVVGYDTKSNKLVVRRYDSGVNKLLTYDDSDGSVAVISSSFASGVSSWQAGGIGAVDSFGRTAFQLKPGATSKIYKVNLDDGTEESISISAYITTIAWDSKNKKLFGLYDSNSNGAYRVAEIDTTTGDITNIGSADTVNGMGNYVQLIAPNDQRYYVQQSNSLIIAVSLADGSVLGTFSAPLRVLPPGAVVLGSNSDSEEVVEFDITDPTSVMIKLGSNEVDYQGDSDSSGDILVEDGLLSMNGTAEDASAVVAEGATLGGSGTVGGIESSGTVAPGNSIGTLRVSGNVVLLNGSTMIIEVDSSGNNDKVIATGSVTIDGDLQISAASGEYNNQTYTFLSGSSLSGQFDSVSITGCSATPTVSYSSTDASFVIVSCNNNQSSNTDSTISYLNDLNSGASGDLATVLNAINGLSGTAYSNAISQIDSDASSVMPAVISNAGAASVSSVSSRIGAINSTTSFTFNSLGDPLNTLNENDKKGLSQKGWWFDAFVGSTNADAQSNLGLNGYENDYHGTTIGYDQSNNDGGYKGVAVTLSKGSISFDSSAGVSDYDTYSVSPYYSFSSDSGTTTIHGSFSFTDIETKRYLQFGSINRTASSSYDAISYGFGVDHQLNTKIVGDSFHTTILGASIKRLTVDGYSETGANSLNLDVDKFSQDSLSLRLAHRINWERQTKTSLHKPFIDFGLGYEHRFGSQNSSQALSGQTKWTTTVAEDSELSGVVGAGYLVIDGDSQISMGVKYKESETFTDLLGSIQYKKSF